MATYVSHKLELTVLFEIFAAALVWFPFYGLPGCFVAVVAYRISRAEGSSVSPPRRPSGGAVASAEAAAPNIDDEIGASVSVFLGGKGSMGTVRRRRRYHCLCAVISGNGGNLTGRKCFVAGCTVQDLSDLAA